MTNHVGVGGGGHTWHSVKNVCMVRQSSEEKGRFRGGGLDLGLALDSYISANLYFNSVRLRIGNRGWGSALMKKKAEAKYIVSLSL
jgi:hypothetical protein